MRGWQPAPSLTLRGRALISDFSKVVPEVSWRDIAFGAGRGLISSKEVADYALSHINESTEDNDLPILLNLAYDEPSEGDMVSMCESLSSPAELLDAEKRWRYALVHDAIFCNATSRKKLEQLDSIYAFFGYPEEMSHFIYYMPQSITSIANSANPDSPEERILSEAQRYLDEKRAEIGIQERQQ